MHSKWRYKICICSFIPGEDSFRNCKGFSFIIPKSLDAIYRFTKVRIFLIPPSNSKFENVRLPFATKNSLTWGSEI